MSFDLGQFGGGSFANLQPSRVEYLDFQSTSGGISKSGSPLALRLKTSNQEGVAFAESNSDSQELVTGTANTQTFTLLAKGVYLVEIVGTINPTGGGHISFEVIDNSDDSIISRTEAHHFEIGSSTLNDRWHTLLIVSADNTVVKLGVSNRYDGAGPDLTACRFYLTPFAGAAGTPGTNAPQLQVRYAATGTPANADIHSTFETGDKYLSLSTDGGTTWSAWIFFAGQDGTPGVNAPVVQIQYAASATPDNADIHTDPESGDEYLRFSVDGGTTWSSWAKFVGEGGGGGSVTYASEAEALAGDVANKVISPKTLDDVVGGYDQSISELYLPFTYGTFSSLGDTYTFEQVPNITYTTNSADTPSANSILYRPSSWTDKPSSFTIRALDFLVGTQRYCIVANQYTNQNIQIVVYKRVSNSWQSVTWSTTVPSTDDAFINSPYAARFDEFRILDPASPKKVVSGSSLVVTNPSVIFKTPAGIFAYTTKITHSSQSGGGVIAEAKTDYDVDQVESVAWTVPTVGLSSPYTGRAGSVSVVEGNTPNKFISAHLSSGIRFLQTGVYLISGNFGARRDFRVTSTNFGGMAGEFDVGTSATTRYFTLSRLLVVTSTSTYRNFTFVNLGGGSDPTFHIQGFEVYRLSSLEGLAGVSANFPIATQAEAEAGTDNTKGMTPLRTQQWGDQRGGVVRKDDLFHLGEATSFNQDDFSANAQGSLWQFRNSSNANVVPTAANVSSVAQLRIKTIAIPDVNYIGGNATYNIESEFAALQSGDVIRFFPVSSTNVITTNAYFDFTLSGAPVFAGTGAARYATISGAATVTGTPTNGTANYWKVEWDSDNPDVRINPNLLTEQLVRVDGRNLVREVFGEDATGMVAEDGTGLGVMTLAEARAHLGGGALVDLGTFQRQADGNFPTANDRWSRSQSANLTYISFRAADTSQTNTHLNLYFKAGSYVYLGDGITIQLTGNRSIDTSGVNYTTYSSNFIYVRGAASGLPAVNTNHNVKVIEFVSPSQLIYSVAHYLQNSVVDADDQTIALRFNGLPDGTPLATDTLQFTDASDSNKLKKAAISTILALGGGVDPEDTVPFAASFRDKFDRTFVDSITGNNTQGQATTSSDNSVPSGAPSGTTDFIAMDKRTSASVDQSAELDKVEDGDWIRAKVGTDYIIAKIQYSQVAVDGDTYEFWFNPSTEIDETLQYNELPNGSGEIRFYRQEEGSGGSAFSVHGLTEATAARTDYVPFSDENVDGDPNRRESVADLLGLTEATDVSVDASGFDGNLETTDDTVQKVAQKLDDLSVGGGGSSVRIEQVNLSFTAMASALNNIGVDTVSVWYGDGSNEFLSKHSSTEFRITQTGLYKVYFRAQTTNYSRVGNFVFNFPNTNALAADLSPTYTTNGSDTSFEWPESDEFELFKPFFYLKVNTANGDCTVRANAQGGTVQFAGVFYFIKLD